MPIIKSAKKRVKVANKAAIRNSKTKRTLKTAFKSFHATLTGASHSSAQSALDKAAKKGLVHKNKVARLKKQASAKAKAAGAKPAPASSSKTKTATKPAATKAAPKKAAPAKKPVAKKAPAKKK